MVGLELLGEVEGQQRSVSVSAIIADFALDPINVVKAVLILISPKDN